MANQRARAEVGRLGAARAPCASYGPKERHGAALVHDPRPVGLHEDPGEVVYFIALALTGVAAMLTVVSGAQFFAGLRRQRLPVVAPETQSPDSGPEKRDRDGRERGA